MGSPEVVTNADCNPRVSLNQLNIPRIPFVLPSLYFPTPRCLSLPDPHVGFESESHSCILTGSDDDRKPCTSDRTNLRHGDESTSHYRRSVSRKDFSHHKDHIRDQNIRARA
jgi:hypothetical protein